MKLNKCQSNALSKLSNWFHYSPEKNFILDGAGGTGKSTLVDFFLGELGNIKILILAPTHEALFQLREKTRQTDNILFKTFAAGLGISPTTTAETLQFSHRAFPAFIKDIQLIIVDEASMIPEWQFSLIQELNIKILWIGHKSQLPPVEGKTDDEGRPEYRSLSDLCESPVFGKGIPSVVLKEPMRNKGALWKFTQQMEERIYNGEPRIPNTFDCSLDTIRKLVKNEEGRNMYREGRLKTVVYRNAEIRTRTEAIRRNLFGKHADEYKYLVGDLIILTSPINLLPEELESLNDFEVKSYIGNKGVESLYTNTKATILSVKTCVVNLSRNFSVPCYKLEILTTYGTRTTIYEPTQIESIKAIDDYYTKIAWGTVGQEKKNRAFIEKHFILHCFARILHFYAATTYRLQGSSIEKVIVIARDLNRIQNKIERAKHGYVACSRASGESGLMFYRG